MKEHHWGGQGWNQKKKKNLDASSFRELNISAV
jgi:hypothetical protein